MDMRKFNKGRGIAALDESTVQTKLDADQGLMRERLKVAGNAALFTVLTKKRLTRKGYAEVTDALITLRNQWLLKGFENALVEGGTDNEEEFRHSRRGVQRTRSKANPLRKSSPVQP